MSAEIARQLRICALWVCAMVTLAACAAQAETEVEGSAEDFSQKQTSDERGEPKKPPHPGEVIFMSSCAGCHPTYDAFEEIMSARAVSADVNLKQLEWKDAWIKIRCDEPEEAQDMPRITEQMVSNEKLTSVFTYLRDKGIFFNADKEKTLRKTIVGEAPEEFPECPKTIAGE